MKKYFTQNLRFFVILLNAVLLVFWNYYPADETSVYMLLLIPALLLINIGGLFNVIAVFRLKKDILEVLISFVILIELYLILY